VTSLRKYLRFVEALEPAYSASTSLGYLVLVHWDSGWAVAYGLTETEALLEARKAALRQVLS